LKALSAQSMRRMLDSIRMDYSALTTSTVQDLLGREPIHLAAWATAHRRELLDQLL
jgi:hypothetical protein